MKVEETFKQHIKHSPIVPRDSKSTVQYILPFSYSLQEKQVYQETEKSEENKVKEVNKNAPFYIPIEQSCSFEEDLSKTKDDELFISKERQNYLSVDTRRALFEKANWFQLNQKDLLLATINLDGKNVSVIASNIKLVLFEFSKAQKQETNKHDLNNDELAVRLHLNNLRTGFVIFDTKLTCDERLTVADYCTITERFRLLEPKFPEQENSDERKDYEKIKQIVCEMYNNEFEKQLQTLAAQHKKNHQCACNYKCNCEHIGVYALFLERITNFMGHWLQFIALPIKHNNTYYQLVNNEKLSSTLSHSSIVHCDKADTKDSIFEYPDNRLFVRTLIDLPKGAESIVINNKFDNFKHSNQWVTLLNVDEGATLIREASDFEKKWADERTYERWLHYGSLFGFNYNSTAFIGSIPEDPPLDKHYKEQYLDITLLLLFGRVSLFRFNHELNEITRKAIDSENWLTSVKEKFSGLRSNFSAFVNLYKFPLISNQQQAIEMYAIQREIMDVKEFFEEIESEIKNTHDFIELVQNSLIQSQTSTLNKTVLFAGLLGVVATLFTINSDINIFENYKKEPTTVQSSNIEGTNTAESKNCEVSKQTKITNSDGKTSGNESKSNEANKQTKLTNSDGETSGNESKSNEANKQTKITNSDGETSGNESKVNEANKQIKITNSDGETSGNESKSNEASKQTKITNSDGETSGDESESNEASKQNKITNNENVENKDVKTVEANTSTDKALEPKHPTTNNSVHSNYQLEEATVSNSSITTPSGTHVTSTQVPSPENNDYLVNKKILDLEVMWAITIACIIYLLLFQGGETKPKLKEEVEGERTKRQENRPTLTLASKLLIKVGSSVKRIKEAIIRWAVNAKISKPLFIIVATITIVLVYIVTDYQKSN